MQLNRIAKALAIAALVLGTITSCGKKRDPGEFIGIAVTPASGALIVPGAGQTCYDKAHTTADSSPKSLTSNRIIWSNFALNWRSSNSLTVVAIRVTIEHPSIKDGKFTTMLTDQEIEYLLGSPGGKITGATTVNSIDANRGGGAIDGLLPCGLAIGGISFDSETPSPFTATALIEVVGVSESADGTQSRVAQKTRATVEYY